MNITKFIPNTLTRSAGRSSLVVQKNAPHILFGLGVVAQVTGTVLACRATLKLPALLDDIKEDIDVLKDDMETNSSIVFSENEKRKNMAYAHMHAAARVGRLYAPAVLVSGAGLVMLTKSHTTMNNRNKAITAAYAGLHTAYENYRARVREDVGEEKELEYYHAIDFEKVKGEDGKPVDVGTPDPNKWSAHARMFDVDNPNWHKDPEINKCFIRAQQLHLNDLLTIRGHVFLNEVYDALGMERSQAGQVVGWVVNRDGPDNFIDFDLFNPHNSRFVNGEERSVILDFNVNGIIYDKI